MAAPDRPRVAVVGTSHWHHKFYRETLAHDAEIVGFSDPSAAKLKEVEPFYGNGGSLDWHALLDPALKLDAVMVLAPHDEMREVCLEFIARDIPIILEKPGGMNADEVKDVRDAAARRGVPITVAFIQRLGNLWQGMQRVGQLDYATFLSQSGPPERYVNQSPWALQRVHAGGGSFINIAVHFIDLFLQATHAKSLTVQAQAQARLSKAYDVEDRMTALVSTDDGVSAIFEIGYLFPAAAPNRYLAYTARGSEGWLEIAGTGDITFISLAGKTETKNDNVDSMPLTGIFMRDAIAGIRNGFAGMAGVADLHRAMQVVDAAYASAYEKRAVPVDIAW